MRSSVRGRSARQQALQLRVQDANLGSGALLEALLRHLGNGGQEPQKHFLGLRVVFAKVVERLIVPALEHAAQRLDDRLVLCLGAWVLQLGQRCRVGIGFGRRLGERDGPYRRRLYHLGNSGRPGSPCPRVSGGRRRGHLGHLWSREGRRLFHVGLADRRLSLHGFIWPGRHHVTLVGFINGVRADFLGVSLAKELKAVSAPRRGNQAHGYHKETDSACHPDLCQAQPLPSARRTERSVIATLGKAVNPALWSAAFFAALPNLGVLLANSLTPRKRRRTPHSTEERRTPKMAGIVVFAAPILGYDDVR